MLLPVRFPGCQVYEAAPLAVKVALLPAQIADGPVIPRLPLLLTFTVSRLFVLQLPLVPVTVYVVVTVGFTVTDDPIRLPGCQT